MAEDIDRVIAWARSQGWPVTTSTDGYRHFWTPDHQWVAKYPATPSNPRRRLTEVIVAIRKAGLEWPPPSRKVQRSRRRKEGR